MTKWISRLVIHISFMLLGAILILAQTAGTGAITGVITDTSGAVIPNAKVQIVNVDTGQQRSVTTAADGSYSAGLLTPGTYKITFSVSGFKTVEVPRVTVAVTETQTLNQSLQVGAQGEQITVSETTEAIQTSNATLGTILGSNQIASLPLTNRNYSNTLALSAGVSASVTNASALGKGGMDFSVNGASTQSNNIMIDGQNMSVFSGVNSNTSLNGSTYASMLSPSPDALQEFKVQTSSYDAGYGRNSGANVNALTKSGTNEFHGTAFEFFRNTDLNANDFFLNLSGQGKGILNQNQYGGVLGGPIKKNKLFFFGSYQGTRQKDGIAGQGGSALVLPPIPTGDRSNTAAFQAAVGAAFCPANHSGSSAYNTLHGGLQVACDGSNINPIAIGLMQYKFPNGAYLFPGSTNGAFQNETISRPATYGEDQELANFDYIMSSQHTLSGRFIVSNANAVFPFDQSAVTGAQVPGFTVPDLNRDWSEVLRLTSVLGSTLVNEARISSHREVGNENGNNSGLSDHQFGITPNSPFQDYSTPGYISEIAITGAYNIGVGGSGLDFITTTSNSYQAADQISWVRGKHTIRAGFEAEQIRMVFTYPGLGIGAINISTFDDFLLGLPGCAPPATTCTTPGTTGTAFSSINSITAADALGPAGNPHQFHVWDFDSFVQDDIKISQRLTVNLGVRWEYDGMTTDIYGTQTNIWPSAVLQQVNPGSSAATGSLAGWVVPSNFRLPIPAGVTQASTSNTLQSGPPKDDFAPRIGFAWQPFGGNKIVVRGGFGYFYDRIPGQAFTTAITGTPPQAPKVNKSGTTNVASSLAVPFAPNITGTFPTRWVNFTSSTGSSLSQTDWGPNWSTPLVDSYNLGIQYNFLPTWVLDLGYSGSHGIHVLATDTINQALLASASNPINGLTTSTTTNSILRVPYLGFGPISNACTCFDTRYNSLQATLRKQLSHGLQMQASYTWARAFNDSAVTQQLTQPGLSWGPDVNIHPQRLSINYFWNIPSGNLTGAAGLLLGGWALSGITTVQTGTPLTITDSRGGTIYGQSTARAELCPGSTYSQVLSTGNITSRLGGATGGSGYFNASTFCTIPAIDGGTGWGNSGPGIVLGPGQFNFDSSLTKMTRVGGIHENAMLQFRTEFFNAFNHAQFSNPILTDSTATFGQITSTTVNPRLIQFALKYIF